MLIRATILTLITLLVPKTVTQLPSDPHVASYDQIPETVTAEQQELVDFAIGRFAHAGLELPAVDISFESDPNLCFGYGGVYVPSDYAVRICRPSETTMVHELAHAWIETTFTETERHEFLQLRGLEAWTEVEQWDQRGAEHAAEIITWAIMDRNISVRWLATDSNGTTAETWKLYKLAHSSPDELIAAYEQLTGLSPTDRIADDPRNPTTTTETGSPEANRG